MGWGPVDFRQRESWAFGSPKEMKTGFHSAAAPHGSATLPFVVPTRISFIATARNDHVCAAPQNLAPGLPTHRGMKLGFVSGYDFTACGKMLVWRRKQPSAAKAELIAQQLRTA
jgi:hypothetical protein